MTESNEQQRDRALKQVIADQNKKLPMMLNEEIRLDSMLYINQMWGTYGTNVKLSKEEFFGIMGTAYLQDTAKPVNTRHYCTNMAFLVEDGVPGYWAFYDKNGDFMGKIVVYPADCDSIVEVPADHWDQFQSEYHRQLPKVNEHFGIEK